MMYNHFVIEGSEYSYKTFQKKEDEPLDLGEHKAGVEKLFRKLNLMETYPEEDAALELNEHLQMCWLYLVAVLYTDNTVVGYGALGGKKDDEELDLDEAYIDENHRRKGIYKNVLGLRLKVAQELGAKTVSLMPGTTATQTGYLESLGFNEYYDGNIQMYRKELK